MVVDTSALVAALTGEREANAVLEALASDPAPCLSAGALLEARVVMQARYGDEGVRDLDLLPLAERSTP